MVKVLPSDVELFNTLISKSDDRRDKLSITLLTVYSAATSGLFTLVIATSEKITLLNNAEKALFLTVFLTGLLIVFTSLLQRVLSYLSVMQVSDMHAKRMREEDHSANGLFPKPWVSSCLLALPFVQIILMSANVFAIALFVVLRII